MYEYLPNGGIHYYSDITRLHFIFNRLSRGPKARVKSSKETYFGTMTMHSSSIRITGGPLLNYIRCQVHRMPQQAIDCATQEAEFYMTFGEDGHSDHSADKVEISGSITITNCQLGCELRTLLALGCNSLPRMGATGHLTRVLI